MYLSLSPPSLSLSLYLSCAQRRAKASSSVRRAAARSPPQGACTSSSTSERELSASGSIVEPTRRTTCDNSS